MLTEEQLYLFAQIQTSQTGGQLYSETTSYGDCSLPLPYQFLVKRQHIRAEN